MKPGARAPSARFFDAIARRYDRAYALGADATRARMKRVVAELPRSPAAVLDLGVGTGRELPTLLDAGYDVTGLDFSRAMLDQCARRGRAIALVEADLWSPLPFDDARFDAAIALHGTLAHPTRDGAQADLARELGRVIRSGGRFVAELPARAWLDALDEADDGDTRIARVAPGRAIYEDRVAGVAIEAVIPREDEWTLWLAPWFDATCERLGASETLLVARRL